MHIFLFNPHMTLMVITTIILILQMKLKFEEIKKLT